ncbi:MAG: hypothetical protein P8X95_24860 [Anaerolineales bacterium]
MYVRLRSALGHGGPGEVVHPRTVSGRHAQGLRGHRLPGVPQSALRPCLPGPTR